MGRGRSDQRVEASPMERAVSALKKAAGRSPSVEERSRWEDRINTLVSFYRAEIFQESHSVPRANAIAELEDIRKAARSLHARLSGLSRDAYYPLVFGGLTGPSLSLTPEEENHLAWEARLGRAPKNPGTLANEMKVLERMAERANRILPTGLNGAKTVFESQVGSPEYSLFSFATRAMNELAGRVYGLRAFAVAIHELATGHPPQDRWAADAQTTVAAWWKKIGPHDRAIFEAELRWDGAGNLEEWQVQETGLPVEVIRLSWGPHMLRETRQEPPA